MILLFSRFEIPAAEVILTFIGFACLLLITSVLFLIASKMNDVTFKNLTKSFSFSGLIIILLHLILAFPMVFLHLELWNYFIRENNSPEVFGMTGGEAYKTVKAIVVYGWIIITGLIYLLWGIVLYKKYQRTDSYNLA